MSGIDFDLGHVDLTAIPDAALLFELERRSREGHPVLSQCPECTRSDAIVCIWCGDHGGGVLPGIFLFPLRGRAVANLDRLLRPVLTLAKVQGVDLFELPSMKQKALES